MAAAVRARVLRQELTDIVAWDTPALIQAPTGEALSALAQADADAGPSDKATTHTYGGDLSALPQLPPALAAAQFGSWADVASTLFIKTMQVAGWSPQTSDLDPAAWAAYRHKFATNPYWTGLEFNIQHRESQLHVRDYRNLVGGVVGLIEGVFAPDAVEKTVTSLRQLAEQIARHEVREDKDTLGQHALIGESDSGRLYCGFLFGSVSVKVEEGKYTAIDQSLDVWRAYGLLNYDFCNRHTDRILQYEFGPLDAFDGLGNADHQPPSTSEGF